MADGLINDMMHKQTAWRIAGKFLELRKERRAELAKLIEAELDYAAELAAHTQTVIPVDYETPTIR